MENENIVIEILNALNNRSKEFRNLYNSGDAWQGDWTELMKQTINQLALDKQARNRMGFDDVLYTYTNTKKNKSNYDGNEWLFDLVWCEMNSFEGEEMVTMRSLPLILESEISKMDWGGFKEDFDKLLVATSSTRVFITRNLRVVSNSKDELDKKIQYAEKAVNTYLPLQKGKGVYIIIWDEKGNLSDDIRFIN